MLYVKVDANGNPTEVAKNFTEIKEEYTAKNTAIPNEGSFLANLSNFGYAEVPVSDPPSPQAGKKIVPDVPTKNADGTMKRTWKYMDADLSESSNVEALMRERRRILLNQYIDRISPVRWDKFTEAEKTEISTWHQSLLDISDQEGWPYVSFQPVPEVLK